MNAATPYERSEARQIAKQLADSVVLPEGSLTFRRPNDFSRGPTATNLRKKIRTLGGATGSLVKVGRGNYYVAQAGRYRATGTLSEIEDQLAYLFVRFGIS